MKKRSGSIILALLLIFTLVPAVSASEIITFPDANFEAAVREAIGKPTGSITKADVAGVRELHIDELGISDLSGIEHFLSLRLLWCSGNNLTALDVSNNTALESLSCDNNKLTALDMSNNPMLEVLDCSNNKLDTLDTSKNAVLEMLACYNNKLAVLDVSKNPMLETLYCSDNKLTALDVSKNTMLEGLWCNNNKLTMLDVSKNIALEQLWLGNNKLSTLDVSKNIRLEGLECINNKLTTLDVRNCIKLETLWCGSNNLTKLDVGKNTALEQLYCYDNQLTTLDVSKNTALEQLDCYDNQLATLDVSKNTALEYLYCSYNNFTKLDVSKNITLKRFYCGYNYFPSKSAIIGLDESRLNEFVFDPQHEGTPPTSPLNTASDWAREGIVSAIEKGFVPGDLQDDYRSVITRGEFCRMALNFLEYKTGKDAAALLAEKGLSLSAGAFEDTSDPDILAAYALGITAGTRAPDGDTPGLFTPDGAFTRQQAATMIMNTCRAAGMDVSAVADAGFTDIADAAAWARDAINFCYSGGIMSGTSTESLVFSPLDTYTREQSILTFNNIK